MRKPWLVTCCRNEQVNLVLPCKWQQARSYCAIYSPECCYRKDLPIMPIATNAETAAKPFCRCGPASRDAIRRLPIIPARVPASALGAMLLIDTSAMTANEVATMDCIARSV